MDDLFTVKLHQMPVKNLDGAIATGEMGRCDSIQDLHQSIAKCVIPPVVQIIHVNNVNSGVRGILTLKLCSKGCLTGTRWTING
jgi:hypothetical protein